MDAKLKSEWVKALRSGKYKQGKRWLSRGGYHCCLGVLRCIDESVKKHGTDEMLDPRTCGVLWKTQEALSWRNDEGMSFLDIADYIEKNIK